MTGTICAVTVTLSVTPSTAIVTLAAVSWASCTWTCFVTVAIPASTKVTL